MIYKDFKILIALGCSFASIGPLMRNLCSRMGVNYRGDLDKVNGEFITAGGYTLRVGFVVDSLLAINPEKFRGCDLVIDEVVQVLRHLLTSSTCNRGMATNLTKRYHISLKPSYGESLRRTTSMIATRTVSR